jgi:hypothetical protein
LISDWTVAKLRVPDAHDSKHPTRLSALSRYQGLLHADDDPLVQHVLWPSSALTIEHCVHVELAS